MDHGLRPYTSGARVNLALPIIEAAGAHAFDQIMMPLSLALIERCDACLPHRRRVTQRRPGGGTLSRGRSYFRCLAEGTPGDVFAREVDRAISDFADYERPRHLAAARRVANAKQKAALRRQPGRERRR